MYLLWDVAEVLKQSSHQAKLLSGFSNQGSVDLTQAATFSFPENGFPFCFGCQEAQSPTKAPLLASAENFAGHLVYDSVLDCFLLSCSFCDVYSDLKKNLHLSVLLL